MWELSKSFTFEAAHTLERVIDAQASRRVHGHSYRVEVALRGTIDSTTGMTLDYGLFEQRLASVRDELDHRFLDDTVGLGPPTMENLSTWIWRRLAPTIPGLARVTVYRDSLNQACSYFGPGAC
jgi:6-pyruvoyltetrahydropterin/6-carboxytetrahydropterin synthase